MENNIFITCWFKYKNIKFIEFELEILNLLTLTLTINIV
jgi:hypothetical protein